MSYSASVRGNVGVIAVQGALDEALQATVDKCVSQQARHVILDLAQAEPIIAADTPHLLRAVQKVTNQGAVFGLAAAPANASFLIVLLGLEKQIPIYGSVADGLEDIRKRSVGHTRQEEEKRPPTESGGGATEEGVRSFIQVVARSLRHVKLFESMVSKGTGLLVSKELAKAMNEKLADVEQVLDELKAVRIIKAVAAGTYKFEPTVAARKVVSELMTMWKHPTRRKQIMTWVTEAAQTVRKKGDTSKLEKKEGGLFGRLFGRE